MSKVSPPGRRPIRAGGRRPSRPARACPQCFATRGGEEIKELREQRKKVAKIL